MKLYIFLYQQIHLCIIFKKVFRVEILGRKWISLEVMNFVPNGLILVYERYERYVLITLPVMFV